MGTTIVFPLTVTLLAYTFVPAASAQTCVPRVIDPQDVACVDVYSQGNSECAYQNLNPPAPSTYQHSNTCADATSLPTFIQPHLGGEDCIFTGTSYNVCVALESDPSVPQFCVSHFITAAPGTYTNGRVCLPPYMAAACNDINIVLACD